MKSTIDAQVGIRVCRTREFRGVRLHELADVVGVRPSEMERLESGADRLTAAQLIDIASYLRIAPSFFLQGIGGGKRTAPALPPDVIAPIAAKPRPTSEDRLLAILVAIPHRFGRH